MYVGMESFWSYTLKRTGMYAPMIVALGVVKHAPMWAIATIVVVIAGLVSLSWCVHALARRYGGKFGRLVAEPCGAGGQLSQPLDTGTPLRIKHDVGNRARSDNLPV